MVHPWSRAAKTKATPWQKSPPPEGCYNWVWAATVPIKQLQQVLLQKKGSCEWCPHCQAGRAGRDLSLLCGIMEAAVTFLHHCNGNHRTVWFERDIERSSSPIPLQQAGTSSTWFCCSEPRPASPWVFPGMASTTSLSNPFQYLPTLTVKILFQYLI